MSEVRTRHELLALVRGRAREIGASRTQIDTVANFCDGYAGKLLGPRQVRTPVHESLFTLLWALGLKLVIDEDPAALAAVKPHYGRKRPFGANQHERQTQETLA